MEGQEGTHRDIAILKVDESGRLVLPIESHVRQFAKAGDTLVGIEEPDGSFRVKRHADVIREIQDYCLQFGDPNQLWSEELSRERREEAAHE